MPGWRGSDRKSRLPAGWEQIRRRILRRADYQCQWVDPEWQVRCPARATDVDHIVSGKQLGWEDDRDSNLRALCGPHHQSVSSRQGGEALAAKRREISQRFRRPEY